MLFSFQSVSQPVLSESLATVLDVVINFQRELSCRVHAIVSKLCRFFSCLFETPPIPRLLYFENERIKSSLSFQGTLNWHRRRVRVTKINSEDGVRKNFSDDLWSLYVTVYRKTGHNAACVIIEKRSIEFLKMYCFKPTEGNG